MSAPPTAPPPHDRLSEREGCECLVALDFEASLLKVLAMHPDPLLMNAFNTVNLAAACILTSVENARRLGVPEEKWVYPLGGAGRKEKERCKSSRHWSFVR